MRFLKRLLGRGDEPPPEEAASEEACPHTSLVPHWDSPDDMGKPDAVSSYLCEACQANFSREEGDRLQAAEAERVRQLETTRGDEQ